MKEKQENENFKADDSFEVVSPEPTAYQILERIRNSGAILHASHGNMIQQMENLGVNVAELNDAEKELLESFVVNGTVEEFCWTWPMHDATKYRNVFTSFEELVGDAKFGSGCIDYAEKVIKDDSFHSYARMCAYIGTAIKQNQKWYAKKKGCGISNVLKGVYGEKAFSQLFSEDDNLPNRIHLSRNMFPTLIFDKGENSPLQIRVVNQLIERGIKFRLDFKKNREVGFKQIEYFGPPGSKAREDFIDKVCVHDTRDEMQFLWGSPECPFYANGLLFVSEVESRIHHMFAPSVTEKLTRIRNSGALLLGHEVEKAMSEIGIDVNLLSDAQRKLMASFLFNGREKRYSWSFPLQHMYSRVNPRSYKDLVGVLPQGAGTIAFAEHALDVLNEMSYVQICGYVFAQLQKCSKSIFDLKVIALSNVLKGVFGDDEFSLDVKFDDISAPQQDENIDLISSFGKFCSGEVKFYLDFRKRMDAALKQRRFFGPTVEGRDTFFSKICAHNTSENMQFRWEYSDKSFVEKRPMPLKEIEDRLLTPGDVTRKLTRIRNSGALLHGSDEKVKEAMSDIGIQIEHLTTCQSELLQSFAVGPQVLSVDESYFWSWPVENVVAATGRKNYEQLVSKANPCHGSIAHGERTFDFLRGLTPVQICNFIAKALVSLGTAYFEHKRRALSNVLKGIFADDQFSLDLRIDDIQVPEKEECLSTSLASRLVAAGFKFHLDFRKNLAAGVRQIAFFGPADSDERKIFLDEICVDDIRKDFQFCWQCPVKKVFTGQERVLAELEALLLPAKTSPTTLEMLTRIRNSGGIVIGSTTTVMMQMEVLIGVKQYGDFSAEEKALFDQIHVPYGDLAVRWDWPEFGYQRPRIYNSFAEMTTSDSYLVAAEKRIEKRLSICVRNPARVCFNLATALEEGKFYAKKQGSAISNIFRGLYGEKVFDMLFDDDKNLTTWEPNKDYFPRLYKRSICTNDPEANAVVKSLILHDVKFHLDFREKPAQAVAQIIIFDGKARSDFVDFVCKHDTDPENHLKWFYGSEPMRYGCIFPSVECMKNTLFKWIDAIKEKNLSEEILGKEGFSLVDKLQTMGISYFSNPSSKATEKQFAVFGDRDLLFMHPVEPRFRDYVEDEPTWLDGYKNVIARGVLDIDRLRLLAESEFKQPDEVYETLLNESVLLHNRVSRERLVATFGEEAVERFGYLNAMYPGSQEETYLTRFVGSERKSFPFKKGTPIAAMYRFALAKKGSPFLEPVLPLETKVPGNSVKQLVNDLKDLGISHVALPGTDLVPGMKSIAINLSPEDYAITRFPTWVKEEGDSFEVLAAGFLHPNQLRILVDSYKKTPAEILDSLQLKGVFISGVGFPVAPLIAAFGEDLIEDVKKLYCNNEEDIIPCFCVPSCWVSDMVEKIRIPLDGISLPAVYRYVMDKKGGPFRKPVFSITKKKEERTPESILLDIANKAFETTPQKKSSDIEDKIKLLKTYATVLVPKETLKRGLDLIDCAERNPGPLCKIARMILDPSESFEQEKFDKLYAEMSKSVTKSQRSVVTLKEVNPGDLNEINLKSINEDRVMVSVLVSPNPKHLVELPLEDGTWGVLKKSAVARIEGSSTVMHKLLHHNEVRIMSDTAPVQLERLDDDEDATLWLGGHQFSLRKIAPLVKHEWVFSIKDSEEAYFWVNTAFQFNELKEMRKLK
jgi:hypothetical protein